MPRIVAIAALLLAAQAAWAAEPIPPHHRPVKAIADQRLEVKTPAGAGLVPLYVSRDWTRAQPDITRAVLVFHGRLRNADVYWRSAQEALAAAGDAGRGALLVVPQFLAEVDVRAHSLPATMLRWDPGRWMGGEEALGPAPLSSFDAIDAVLERLADRSLFPHLATIVVAGHSGGGQVVQRYAVAGHAATALMRSGVQVRFVVANPSSYVYFSAERPTAQGSKGEGAFAPFDAARCPGFNRWKYGFDAAPQYVLSGTTPAQLERAYAGRDVIYLLGQNDTDPHHPALDVSCEAEAEGPARLFRGRSYFRYLQSRDAQGLRHRVWEIPGVGHDGRGMLTSACGLAALFDKPGCTPP